MIGACAHVRIQALERENLNLKQKLLDMQEKLMELEAGVFSSGPAFAAIPIAACPAD